MREQRLKIREFLAQDGIHLAPSCADAFGAAVIERLGFEAIHLSGMRCTKAFACRTLVSSAPTNSRVAYRR